MKLTPNFTFEEMIASDIAIRRGIDNTPNASQFENLKRLAETLELVRALLDGRPIKISSGFRCLALNAAVGSDAGSFHPLGLAADFTCKDFGPPAYVCKAIAASDIIQFDQLIFEGTWCHLGITHKGLMPRREILTARFRPGQKTLYTEGIEG